MLLPANQERWRLECKLEIDNTKTKIQGLFSKSSISISWILIMSRWIADVLKMLVICMHDSREEVKFACHTVTDLMVWRTNMYMWCSLINNPAAFWKFHTIRLVLNAHSRWIVTTKRINHTVFLATRTFITEWWDNTAPWIYQNAEWHNKIRTVMRKLILVMITPSKSSS
jgi:hypothetical protein